MSLAEGLDIVMFLVAIGLLMAGFPVAFTLGGTAIFFAALGGLLGVFDGAFLGALTQRIFGTMTNEVLTAVPLFVFMGVMLERSRVAEDLLDTMGSLFGTLRGGLGISVMLVGALMAASTGIVGATVVTMGLLSLPTMLRRGYDPRLAAGTVAAAGTLGQIIPPSIILVLLGDVMSSAYQEAQLSLGNFSPDTVTVGDLFAGALIPGLALVGLYIVYQVVLAWLRPLSSPAVPREADATARGIWPRVVAALIPPAVLIIAVLGSILAGIATPTEAAAVGAVGSLLLAGARVTNDPRPVYAAGAALLALLVLTEIADLRLGRDIVSASDRAATVAAAALCLVLAWGIAVSLWRVSRGTVLTEVMRSTTVISAMVFVILFGAALFSLVFRGLGGDEFVHSVLTGLPGGAVGAMAMVMLVMFILGFFIDFIEIIFIVVPVVAPVLLVMGIDPVWLGVMMGLNLQTSFLTPPLGFALFYLRGVAPPEVTTLHIYRGVAPFIALQLLALLLLALLPGLATWLPAELFG
ncbi:MAG: TRAP transporter large permease subunit [Alphaproteobacteria bacterium]|nr:TRAP transporter large permease subunit [Alphaproteobacteria bacterium]